MAVLALVLFAVYLLVGFVLRTVLQLRRTGDSGLRGLSGRPGSARSWAGILFAAALLSGLLGPLTALAGLDPIPALDQPALVVPATAATIVGIIATVVTQFAMGTSRRIGVDRPKRPAWSPPARSRMSATRSSPPWSSPASAWHSWSPTRSPWPARPC